MAVQAGEKSGMGWERSVLALLDDLEQQAAGLHLVERDLEVADRSKTEYAQVTLASRLHAAAGRPVRLRLLGGLWLSGRLARTGADWLLLSDPQPVGGADREWIVRHGALAVLQGASARAVPDDALGVLRRLTLGSVLRRLADEGADCVFHLVDGSRLDGRLLRLGADFAEVRLEGMSAADGYDVVRLDSLAAVLRRS
ncbi:MAG: hypothetical protein ACR2FG_07270 [Marmoricola sp.]